MSRTFLAVGFPFTHTNNLSIEILAVHNRDPEFSLFIRIICHTIGKHNVLKIP